jgi:DNA-binding beta-propeller fold protein YncE
MNFLPATPLLVFPDDRNLGGIAMNVSGTLLASVNFDQHCLYICSVDRSGELTTDAVVVGTPGIRGSAHGQFDSPASACFVHRNGIDTLLIADTGNRRVVEVSASGVFLRAIAVKTGSSGHIAYSGVADVIAVSLRAAHAVVLLQYESGAVMPEVTIGSGTGARGRGDGQLDYPHGVTFTADGRYILVADFYNHRVSKFSASSGAFIAHVISKGISYPRDVLECEDGSIVVAQGRVYEASVVCLGEDGLSVQDVFTPSPNGRAFTPFSLSHSSFLNGLVVKTMGGSFLLRDVWMCSNRRAWLTAMSCS